jgi:hypothetical protein
MNMQRIIQMNCGADDSFCIVSSSIMKSKGGKFRLMGG